jgi:soluble lytic murein transglycosylase-like protein
MLTSSSTIVPSIILASFALQESSCNPRTIGGAGEQGLMQITKEKCGGAPGGNCLDPDFNIRTGARYFSETLKKNHGDLLKSIGMYNGWYTGMTYVRTFPSSCFFFVHLRTENINAILSMRKL